MRKLTLLAALVLALSAFAEQMHVWPLGPTSETPIELHYVSFCSPRGGHSIEREGRTLRVTAIDADCNVPALPIPLLQKVRLPELLPFGNYTIELRMDASDPNDVSGFTFAVLNGARRPFEVHPFVVADTRPRYRIEGVSCDKADCSDVTVRVDGATAAALAPADEGGIWVSLPEIADRFEERVVGRFLEVSVEKGGSLLVAPAALWFPFEDTLSAHEQILLPILAAFDGALGSKWTTELTLSNPKPWFIDNANSIGPIHHCVDYPCGERVEPDALRRFYGGFPWGKALHVPRPEAGDLSFSLRIRDTSRAAEGMGTRIPVVREDGLFHGEPIPLLDVPLSPRYRVKVRVYMLEPLMSEQLSGRVVIDKGATQQERPFYLRQDCGVFSCVGTPYFAEVDLPAGAEDERVNLLVELPIDATGWAFATVTNNETHQVTVVSPQ